MKIFHEAPKALFEDVQLNTDGDYALVHLLDSDPEYLALFKEAVDAGREVILDNSIFELGEAFNAEKFAWWVRELKPTWYIVPDALDSLQKTLDQFMSFNEKHPDLPGKRIGVLQGATDDELLFCYDVMAPHCDMVAISFDYSHWTRPSSLSPDRHLMIRRRFFVDTLMEHIKGGAQYVPVHLLGCSLPQEFDAYNSSALRNLIYSVDTSNPVVHGIHMVYYTEDGLDSKIKIKLHTLIDHKHTDEQWLAVMFNILQFRRFCNGQMDSDIFTDGERAR